MKKEKIGYFASTVKPNKLWEYLAFSAKINFYDFEIGKVRLVKRSHHHRNLISDLQGLTAQIEGCGEDVLSVIKAKPRHPAFHLFTVLLGAGVVNLSLFFEDNVVAVRLILFPLAKLEGDRTKGFRVDHRSSTKIVRPKCPGESSAPTGSFADELLILGFRSIDGDFEATCVDFIVPTKRIL